MNLARTFLASLLLALLPSAQCHEPYRMPKAATRIVSMPTPIPAGTARIEVQFHEGLLTVEHGEVAECELEIRLQAETAEQIERLAEGLRPVLERRDADAALVCHVPLPAGAAMDTMRTTWRLRAPSSLAVAVTTRRGSVAARGFGGALSVTGGNGVIDADLRGGAASLSSASGSILLRGDFTTAELTTQSGRIDLALPPRVDLPPEIDLRSAKGEVFVDIRKGQTYDVLYCGDALMVRNDPEVRLEWLQNVQVGELDCLQGRIGALQGEGCGSLRLRTGGLVSIRPAPEPMVGGS